MPPSSSSSICPPPETLEQLLTQTAKDWGLQTRGDYESLSSEPGDYVVKDLETKLSDMKKKSKANATNTSEVLELNPSGSYDAASTPQGSNRCNNKPSNAAADDLLLKARRKIKSMKLAKVDELQPFDPTTMNEARAFAANKSIDSLSPPTVTEGRSTGVGIFSLNWMVEGARKLMAPNPSRPPTPPSEASETLKRNACSCVILFTALSLTTALHLSPSTLPQSVNAIVLTYIFDKRSILCCLLGVLFYRERLFGIIPRKVASRR
jgi:hypothetical protein